MGISKTLFGVTRTVPETSDDPWDSEVTAILVDLIDGVENSVDKDGSGNFVSSLSVDDSSGASLAAGSTLTPTATVMSISGSGGAVTLDATTPIANGTKDGQLLILMGIDALNPVTIQNSGNVRLNGDMEFLLDPSTAGAILALVWDNSSTKWQEAFRNN